MHPCTMFVLDCISICIIIMVFLVFYAFLNESCQIMLWISWHYIFALQGIRQHSGDIMTYGHLKFLICNHNRCHRSIQNDMAYFILIHITFYQCIFPLRKLECTYNTGAFWDGHPPLNKTSAKDCLTLV